MAGNCKPNIENLGKEATYKVLGFQTNSGTGGTVENFQLFNGKSLDSYQNDSFYWYNTSDYVLIEISNDCNIWRSGVTSYASSHIGALRIFKLNEGSDTYEDISSTIKQNISAIGSGSWELYIENLSKGTYKFYGTKDYRLDSEWYIESIEKSDEINFPVKISNDTIESEDDVATYASTLVDGERQLLIADKLNSMYVTDGKGGYSKISKLVDLDNEEVLNKFSLNENGKLLFDGKGIQPDTRNLVVKSELEDVKENYLSKEVFQGNEEDSVKYADNLTTTKKRQPLQYYGTDSNNELGLHYLPINMKDNTGMEQRVCLNVQENVDILIDSLKDISDNKLIIDCYKFTSTEKDIMSTIKTFNNSEKDNFFFNKESVEFTESMHIKKNHILESKLNEDGVYESEIINKDNFFEILGIEGEK